MRLFIALLGLACTANAQPPRFESDVAPLLKTRCVACHSSRARQGGLSVETRDDLLTGGKTGAAAVPNKPSDSLLMSVISSGRMPLSGTKLTLVEIDLLRRWIEGGALRDGEQSAPKLASDKEVFHSILGAKCLVCHGRSTQKGGLDLRTRESMLKGGKSGPAIVPGKPEDSLIVKRIAAQQMPPPPLQEQFSVRGLTDDELDKLKQWIAAGAPVDARVAPSPELKPGARDFWAFQPPKRSAAPSTRQPASNPVDRFVLAKLESKGLHFSPPADRLVLMRRAYIDLIGMPPTPEEVEAYSKDTSPRAYQQLVDRLLESPHYGERWARYWLEAAGYADSEGGVSADTLRPFSWRYRDYVIRALNADKPYNEFLMEQIAGDEMFDHRSAKEFTPSQIDKLVATGFLRLTADSTYSTEQNFFPERYDTIASEIDMLGTAVLGLSVGCARCHDHKYDPIPQRDYYRLSANLMTAYDPVDWLSPSLQCVGVGAKCDDTTVRYLPLKSERERAEVAAHNKPVEEKLESLRKALETKTAPVREKLRAEKLAKLDGPLQADVRQAFTTPEAGRSDAQKALVKQYEPSQKELNATSDEYRLEVERLNREIGVEKAKLRPDPKIRALFDLGGVPTPNRVHLRGDYTNPGELVEPGGLTVLQTPAMQPYRIEKPSFDTSGRRLALARWITQPEHPLTARVFVNRIWQHHFGSGLVSTPGNFGKMGARPTHPELLDWLAADFVANGWSLKKLHRLIMTSEPYRQTSAVDPARQTADPDNVLLSRYPMRRLDADALRDSMLHIAGRLDPTAFGQPEPLTELPDGEVIIKPGANGYRRSIYLTVRRTKPVTLLDSFDAPQLNPNCLHRRESIVSSQALHLMNGDMVRETTRYLAGRLIDDVGDDPAKQVERLYLAAYTRRPDAGESRAAINTLTELSKAWRMKLEAERPAEPVGYKSRWMALATLCHTIFNSAEFLYVD